MEWEKIFANHLSDKALRSKIYKELVELMQFNREKNKDKQTKKPTKNKQTKNSDFKMDKIHDYTFLKRKHTNGQQVYEKVLLTSLNFREIQIKTTMK